MEWGWMQAGLALAVVVALGLFLKACFGGSRMLGGFWDREQRQRRAIEGQRRD
jgi:hypothetical protein